MAFHSFTLLSSLPVPVQKETRSMTHAQAIEGDFIPTMSEEEKKGFTPSELIVYKHALEYKWTVEQLKKLICKYTCERKNYDN